MRTHPDQQKNGGLGDWLFSRTGLATAVAVGILAFLVYTGHTAHLLGALPYLLILSCPLLHIFMHGGHGHHHGGRKPSSDNEEPDNSSQPHKH